ncbi:hypothetical protein [Algoriphagus pacificus]|uniref:Mrr-like domain-containing protein n=1 Tax=Algoriphagus pacificus TaxID=2811234 RepID=A0ABS3CBK4_9BACT|nr:hypothetical protein [Algoriphagus pacificus]MBN7814475.1 hypothetical protein [Algoriphagus pacificus]
MEARKQLRKPENWEDFESLCKKLWGEIWDCKEIKKNGRKGQSQNGVDIYGIPNGENYYFGIQCKGKDEYSDKQLSEKEINNEIELAKAFKPPLKKFYFATTANKDSIIEEYIRIKDIENREQKLFEVHLFSWEDIVDLIDENKETHDWYINLQRFKTKSDVLISFQNNEDTLTGSVPFCEKFTHYTLRASSSTSIFDFTPYSPLLDSDSPLTRGENKSYFKFRLKIKNIGSSPIDNPKLIIYPKGDFVEFGDDNIDNIFISQKTETDIKINEEQGDLYITPHRNVLALEEEYITSKICFKPNLEGANIDLIWKFISNNCKKNGVLKLQIDTHLIQVNVEKFVDFKTQVGTVKSFEDYFENVNKGDDMW